MSVVTRGRDRGRRDNSGGIRTRMDPLCSLPRVLGLREQRRRSRLREWEQEGERVPSRTRTSPTGTDRRHLLSSTRSLRLTISSNLLLSSTLLLRTSTTRSLSSLPSARRLPSPSPTRVLPSHQTDDEELSVSFLQPTVAEDLSTVLSLDNLKVTRRHPTHPNHLLNKLSNNISRLTSRLLSHSTNRRLNCSTNSPPRRSDTVNKLPPLPLTTLLHLTPTLNHLNNTLNLLPNSSSNTTRSVEQRVPPPLTHLLTRLRRTLNLLNNKGCQVLHLRRSRDQ